MRIADVLSQSRGLRRPLVPARPAARTIGLVAVIGSVVLVACLLVVALLESPTIGIDDASPVLLVAVVAVGAIGGTWPALGAAVMAFLLYDVLFTEPRFSLVVADPREWLDLLLFLFVALVIGRLVAVQHARADEAAQRAAEASSLFALSRALAVAGSTDEAAPDIAQRLRADAALDRAVILAGPRGSERVIADTDAGAPLPASAIVSSLVRAPGDEPARWVRTHDAAGAARPAGGSRHYRVRIEIDDAQLGTVVAVRSGSGGPLTRVETRILALAADQLATSLRRDQLRRTATELEIARRSDALKTALIDSVSHDLRTPLASIRATAGGLADPAVAWSDPDRRSAAATIDAEATRLDRLVRGLLDLGRIASGSLHPDLEPHAPWSVLVPVIDRLRPALGARSVTVDAPDDLPPILVDAALIDIVLTNLVDNAARHAPAPAPVRASVGVDDEGWVVIAIDDGGPGVPAESLPFLFDRFWRADLTGPSARRGLGIGLSVVRGLVEAMGGSVEAVPSDLGGLGVRVRLRAVPDSPPDPAEPARESTS